MPFFQSARQHATAVAGKWRLLLTLYLLALNLVLDHGQQVFAVCILVLLRFELTALPVDIAAVTARACSRSDLSWSKSAPEIGREMMATAALAA